MNIYSYLKCDVANGAGLRVVCFFQGVVITVKVVIPKKLGSSQQDFL